jgi:hypothetical protein
MVLLQGFCRRAPSTPRPGPLRAEVLRLPDRLDAKISEALQGLDAEDGWHADGSLTLGCWVAFRGRRSRGQLWQQPWPITLRLDERLVRECPALHHAEPPRSPRGPSPHAPFLPPSAHSHHDRCLLHLDPPTLPRHHASTRLPLLARPPASNPPTGHSSGHHSVARDEAKWDRETRKADSRIGLRATNGLGYHNVLEPCSPERNYCTNGGPERVASRASNL